MSDILSPTSSLSSSTSGSSVAKIVTIDLPPQTQAAVTAGQIIKAAVLASPSPGVVTAKTDLGQIDIHTKWPLPTGTQLTLEVRAVGSQIQATILHMTAVKDALLPQPTVATASPVLPQTPLLPPQVGQTLPAVLLPLPQAAPQQPTATPTMPLPQSMRQEMSLTNALLSLATSPALAAAVTPRQPTKTDATTHTTPPASPSAARTSPTTPLQHVPQSHAQPSSPPLQPTPQHFTGATQARIMPSAYQHQSNQLGFVTIVEHAPAQPLAQSVSPSVPSSSAAQPHSTLSGTVIGVQANGLPMIQTSIGIIRLQTPIQVAVGETLNVQWTPSHIIADDDFVLHTHRAETSELTRTLNHLTRGTDQTEALMKFLQLPLQPQQWPATLALLMSSIKQGDMRQFLPEKVVTDLDDVDEPSSRKLNDDWQALNKTVTDHQVEWKGFALPYIDGGQVRALRWFYRQKEQAHGDEQNTSQRLVVEMDLTLGRMQLDMLVRPLKLDLAVRTDQPLPDEMQQHIQSIFDSALVVGGYQGQLAFVSGLPWPIDFSSRVS